MKMLVPSVSLLSYCLHPILLTPFHGKLMQGFHRCQWLPPILSVKTLPMLCHSMGNHLSVLGQARIESRDSFASVTNAPPARSLKHVTVIQSLNPTQNTTDKVRPSGFSWMPPSVLAYTTKTLISRNGWLGCQASARLSGDQPCIVYQESKRYSPNRR